MKQLNGSKRITRRHLLKSVAAASLGFLLSPISRAAPFSQETAPKIYQPITFKQGLTTVKILVDDFVPQPKLGKPFWPHNRLGGNRGPIEDPESQSVEWEIGYVRATIKEGTNTPPGVWTSLNHPIHDCKPLNFSAIFPPQIKKEFQGRVTDVRIHIRDSSQTGTFQVQLRIGKDVSCQQETPVDTKSIPLTGGDQDILFSFASSLGEVQNLNWQIIGDTGDYVEVDRVELVVTLLQLDLPKRAFLWSYSMLLNNWNPQSGLVRDHAYLAAQEYDNVSASAMHAEATVVAWQLGFISESSAAEIVTKTTQALLNIPRSCPGLLLPHYNGKLVENSEFSSIDTVIACVALLEAREALKLDPGETKKVENVLTDIKWNDLIFNERIRHGYFADCKPINEAIWEDFGTESWLVNFGYAAATGKWAIFDHTPPTANGSGFIDELAWLLVPPPCLDRWGTNWCDYSQKAADDQIGYYKSHPCYSGPPRLFGLSSAYVPIPELETYEFFGVGGETPSGDPVPPNDGTVSLGHAVIVPYYAAMIASLRPTEVFALWEWLETQGLFTPFNNVESLMFIDDQDDKPTCKQIIWNDRKDSWNLSLQTLGWGRYLMGDNNPLYQGMWANDLLKRGYGIMVSRRIFLPIIF